MPPSHKDAWVEAQEAAALLTQNSDHVISLDYVRLLARKGRIRWKKKDGRTNLYLRSDVEAYRVRKKLVEEAA